MEKDLEMESHSHFNLHIFMHACSVMSDSFATPWTVAHQVPLSMKFSIQEYWSGYQNKTPIVLSTRDPPRNKGHIQTESEGLEKVIP